MTTIRPGIYYDVSHEEYRSWPFWNASTIKTLLMESAGAMQYERENPSEPTDDMELGTAAHAAILQPQVFEAAYVVFPGPTRRGNAWEQFKEENTGRTIITASQLQKIIDIRDAVRGNQSARELLDGDGRAEVSIVWHDGVTGAMCKGRIDFLAGARLVDLKTCADPCPRAFINQAAKLHYHVAIAAYVSGLWTLERQVETAHFIAVANKPYHDCVRYDIRPSALHRGRELWEYGLSRALECERNGRWPGTCPEPFEFELPQWAMGKAPEVIESETVDILA